MKAMIAVFLAMTATAEVINGVDLKVMPTTEGTAVMVKASNCNVEAIRVQVRARRGDGWEALEQIKRVTRCDQRPVLFTFAADDVVLVAAYEMAQVNVAVAQ